MAKATKKRKIGLSFGSEDLFLVETEKTSKNYRVTALLDVTSEIPFSIDMFTQHSGPEIVGAELKNVLKKHAIDSKSLAVSFDIGVGNIIKIPFIKKLPEKELASHLTWELQQYIDDDVAEYTYDFDILGKKPSQNSELLLVGARNKVLSFFQEMSRYAGIDLYMVNVDLLAAVNTFEASYECHPNDKIALIEIGERKLVFTLLKGKTFIGYHYLFLDESVQSDFVNSVVELISLNLKTLIDHYELRKEKSKFDRVYLYRTTKKYIVTQFKEAAEQELLIFNPFEGIGLDAKLQGRIDYDPLADNSEYVEALGLSIG